MITPDDRQTFIASLMIADAPLTLDQIVEATGMDPAKVKECAMYLKARGQLIPDHLDQLLVWKLRPQMLTYTEGMRGLSKTLNYQRSKRIARGSTPPPTKKG